jgi:hypothetical protein
MWTLKRVSNTKKLSSGLGVIKKATFMILGWSSLEKVISPFNSFNLQAQTDIHLACHGPNARKKCCSKHIFNYQFPGQSVGVAGFFGVLMATRILLFAVSRASQTNPTDETSLKQKH